MLSTSFSTIIYAAKMVPFWNFMVDGASRMTFLDSCSVLMLGEALITPVFINLLKRSSPISDSSMFEGAVLFVSGAYDYNP